MPIENINTLKGWFVTLAKPVQSQFWSWIDSFRHKSDPITINDLHVDVRQIIQSVAAGGGLPEERTIIGDNEFLMPAKTRLVNIAIKNNSTTIMTDVYFFAEASGPTSAFDVTPRFELAANERKEIAIGITFWEATVIKIYNVTDSITLLIDRK